MGNFARPLPKGATTKHPSELDLSLQWCMHKAPMAIRFVSPMVHGQSTEGNQICLSDGAFTHAPVRTSEKNTFSHCSDRAHFLARATLPPFPHLSATPSPGMGRGGKRGSQEGSVQDKTPKKCVVNFAPPPKKSVGNFARF